MNIFNIFHYIIIFNPIMIFYKYFRLETAIYLYYITILPRLDDTDSKAYT